MLILFYTIRMENDSNALQSVLRNTEGVNISSGSLTEFLVSEMKVMTF